MPATEQRVIACHHMPGARVLTWNGKDLPAELHDLPAGQYLVELVDESAGDAPVLTEEEDEELRRALASFQEGKGSSLAEIRQRIEDLLRKAGR
jgi:hypothetical protein